MKRLTHAPTAALQKRANKIKGVLSEGCPRGGSPAGAGHF